MVGTPSARAFRAARWLCPPYDRCGQIREPSVRVGTLGRHWDDIGLVLDDIGNALDPALPLTAKINRSAVALARDHSIAFYDALIVAAATEAGCDTLFTEDMQHGRSFGEMTIVNPFLEPAS